MGSRSKQIITMFLTIGHFITTTSQNVVTAPLNNIVHLIHYSEALLNVRPEAVFSLGNIVLAACWFYLHVYNATHTCQ